MKHFKLQFIIFLVIAPMMMAQGQPYPDRHTTNAFDGWISCDPSNNPNPAHGSSHWIMYDFSQTYALYDLQFWNMNHPDFLDDGLNSISRRLIYPMLAEAVRCHQQRIVIQPWAIDLGMVLGTGFAPHRGGPLHVIDAIGQRQVMGNLNRLRSILGDRFQPPQELVAMANSGDSFFGGDTSSQKYASSS